jgi:hypothetical protein
VEVLGVTVLVVVRCGDPGCFVVRDTIKATDVDSVNQHGVGQRSSVTIGVDEMPLIAYQDASFAR